MGKGSKLVDWLTDALMSSWDTTYIIIYISVAMLLVHAGAVRPRSVVCRPHSAVLCTAQSSLNSCCLHLPSITCHVTPSFADGSIKSVKVLSDNHMDIVFNWYLTSLPCIYSLDCLISRIDIGVLLLILTLKFFKFSKSEFHRLFCDVTYSVDWITRCWNHGWINHLH